MTVLRPPTIITHQHHRLTGRVLKKLWESRGVRVVEGEAMLDLEDGATYYKTDKGTEVCEVKGTRAIVSRGQRIRQRVDHSTCVSHY